MTLHDQLALAEAQHPGRFFGRASRCRFESTPGYTRVVGGRPVTVCLEPKRDEFMKHYLAQLATK